MGEKFTAKTKPRTTAFKLFQSIVTSPAKFCLPYELSSFQMHHSSVSAWNIHMALV